MSQCKIRSYSRSVALVTPSAGRLNTQSRCLRQLFTGDLYSRSRPIAGNPLVAMSNISVQVHLQVVVQFGSRVITL